MHQPDAQPRPSLYHRYQVHTPWLPSAQPAPQRASRVPVVIAGAGPAGLVTALQLARLGVASVVLAAELQVSEGSRAIVFTQRTLEILHRLGVAAPLVRAGLPWHVGHSHFRGQRVYRMEAPQDEHARFGPMLNLQQPLLEDLLLQACANTGLVQLRWGNRLVGLQPQGEAGVVLTVDTPEGPYTVPADWLVAADGGRSAVRSLLGLQMEGTAYEGRFVIADIQTDLPLPTERLAFFDPDWNPGNTVLMHRQPHHMWRIDYQLPPGESAEDALRPEALRQRIDAQLAMIGHAGLAWTLDWSSVYSARTLTLPSYLHGRVLLAGDAAHLLPIFGVRGANTAFQDAQSLGWQLALVLRGLASPQLLSQGYSTERVGAAREIIDEAGKSTRFMAPPSRGFRLLRDAVLSLSLQHGFVRPLYHWRTSRPHAYRHSALNALDDDNAAFSGGPGPGAPPVDVRLGPDDFLLDHLAGPPGGGFDLLVFTHAAALPADLVQAVDQARDKGLPLRVTAIGPAHAVAGADQTLPDAAGLARQRWGVPAQADAAACLLRPDQHLCARWLAPDGARLLAALRQALQLGASWPGPAAPSPRPALLPPTACLPIACPPPAPTTGPSATAIPSTLDLPGLETVYDALAEALDAVGPERSTPFLVKLALLNAQALGDAERFAQQLRAAQQDL